MPHKDRDARLQYLRDWKTKNRPRPEPINQDVPGLPPLGMMVCSEDGEKIQCHVCGKWYGALPLHVNTMHGISIAEYKEIFEIPRGASTSSPATAEKMRARALERDQGSIGRAAIKALPKSTGRAPGISSRLGSRIKASKSRAGKYLRGGKVKSSDD